MKSLSPRAIVLATSFLTACTAVNTASTSAPPPASSDAAATPTPPSMTPRPQKSCAQPGGDVQFVDALTGKPVVIGQDEKIVATLPPWAPPMLADRWIVQKIRSPFTRRVIIPRVPLIVGALTLGIHDEATVEILPSGRLADDHIRHLQYVADRANLARQARDAGTPLATPQPADQSREKLYLQTEVDQVQAESLGTPPDDQDFQDDDGDPNAQDPHRYLFACKFLESGKYTLILRVMTRKLVITNAYTRVQSRLTAEHAADDVKQRTGYVADQYITSVDRSVAPSLATMSSIKTNKIYLQTYPFREVARMNIAPEPTPTPSGNHP